MVKKSVYQVYHSKRKIQKRIINDSNFTYINLVSIIRNYLGKKRAGVLDIGCGVGTISYYLASKGNYVTGLDIAKNAIKIAKKNARTLHLENNIKFIVADFPKESVNEKFNLIICSEVLEHLEEGEKAIETIYELLEREGILILSTPSANAPLYRLGLLKGHDKHAGHLRRYTVDDLKGIATAVGFNILESRKTEGIFRNFLFVFPLLGSVVVKFANKLTIVSDLLTFIDNIFIRFFGESQVYLIAQKPKKV